MKRTIQDLKARLANIIKPGVPAGIRATNHQGFLVDLIDSLVNPSSAMLWCVETFIVRTDPGEDDLSFTLLNDISQDSFIIVSNKNFIFEDAELAYHCNSLSVTDKNKVNLLINSLYYDFNYKSGEKFQIRYAYIDAAPLVSGTPDPSLTLYSLTHTVINNTQVEISIEISNTSSTDQDVSLFLQLNFFFFFFHCVRTVRGGSHEFIVYTYDLVPEGNYAFALTGTFTGSISSIDVLSKSAFLTSDVIERRLVDTNTYKFIITISNSGSAEVITGVKWYIFTMPGEDFVDEFTSPAHTIYMEQTRTYSVVVPYLYPGSFRMKAYLTNMTLLQQLDFTI